MTEGLGLPGGFATTGARVRSLGRSPMLTSTVLGVAGAISLVGGAAAQTAVAAAKPPTVDEIVVTGSLIRGTSVVGVPVVAFKQEDIKETGVANLADLIHEVANVPRVSLDPQNTNREPSNLTNITTINLHGLDSTSTLTLLNGTRSANAGTQFVGFDVTAIPDNAVRRVDILADGSSATYGSDAVAGVVNIILRQPFDGAETSGRVGIADGYQSYQFGQTFGKTWNSGGIFFAYQYSQNTNLPASARSFYTDNWTSYGQPNQQLFPPLKNVADPGNILVGRTVYAIPAGQNGRNLTAAQLTPGVRNAQSSFLGTDAIGSQYRNSAVLTFNQKLGDKVSFSGDAFFSVRKARRLGTAGVGTTTGSSGLLVPSTNPFFVAGIPGATTSELVKYSLYQDFGASVGTATEKTGRVSGDLKFDLGKGWQADLVGATSADWETSAYDGYSPSALAAAVADTNAATAFNPFGAGSNNNPATLAKIKGQVIRSGHYAMNDAIAKADGPLIELPGGALRIAVGAEVREDHLVRDGKENYLTGLPDTSVYENYLRIRERRTVESAFAEALVPIVGPNNELPWVKRLTLSLAGRFDHYSDSGNTTNPKVGLSWETGIGGLTLEATYGTSYRAPTLVEKDGNTGLAATSLSLTPGGPSVNGLLLMQDGGASLKPVTSTTYTAGFDYQPVWLSGLKTFLHYYAVDTNHYISSPIVNADALYNPTYSRYVVTKDPVLANALTAQYLADPSAGKQILGPAPVLGDSNFVIDSRDANLGKSQTNGVDFGVSYDFANRLGSWGVGVSGTYVFTFRQQQYDGAPYTEFVNTNNPAPLTFEGQASLRWRMRGYHAGFVYNYQNAYDNTDYPNAGIPPYDRVKALGTIDLTLGYNSGEQFSSRYLHNISIDVRVQNLLDTDPPIAFTPDAIRTPIPIDTYHSDVLGRVVSVSINKAW